MVHIWVSWRASVISWDTVAAAAMPLMALSARAMPAARMSLRGCAYIIVSPLEKGTAAGRGA
ncbi:hypothetical protein D3C86_1802040 [compost metagenome]